MSKKKIALSIVSVVAAASICVGGFMVYRNNTVEPVKVYDVSAMNTASWYVDNTELTGQITSEFVQEVFPDTSRVIKKIYVKKGDKVKVGDKLLKYDVEEKELDLKLQELQIKGAKFEVEKMEKELAKLKQERTVPDSTTEADTTPTRVNNNYGDEIGDSGAGDRGFSKASTSLSLLGDNAMLSELNQNIVTLAELDTGIGGEEGGSGIGGDPADPVVPTEPIGPAPTEPVDPVGPTDPTDEPTSEDTSEETEEPSSEETSEDTEEPSTEDTEAPDKDFVEIEIFCLSGTTTFKPGNTYTFGYSPSGALQDEQFVWVIGAVYGNGEESSEMISFNETGQTCTVTIPKNCNVSAFDVRIMPSAEWEEKLEILLANSAGAYVMSNSEIDNPDDDWDDPYYNDYTNYDTTPGSDLKTVSELKEAISEKESDIAKKKQELAQAKISYKEAKMEIDDATIKSKIKGKVTTAYTKKSAPADGSPIIVIKAEDGMYVQTSVSELDLKTVKVGGTIQCTSWNTSQNYEAEIISISDYPLGSQATQGSANPNSSYYKVIGFIAEAEGLSTNDQVTISYNSQSMGTASEDVIYLPKAYVRTDGARSYVFIKGKDNKLKKQFVKIGAYIESGNYLEISSGLKTDDQIAFPYGKNVVDGAKTIYSDDTSQIIF